MASSTPTQATGSTASGVAGCPCRRGSADGSRARWAPISAPCGCTRAAVPTSSTPPSVRPVHVRFRRVLQWWPPRHLRTIGPASPRSRADPRRPAAWLGEPGSPCGRVRVRGRELDARTHRSLLVVAGDGRVHPDSQRRRGSVRGDDREGWPARVHRRPIGRRLDAYRVGDDKARPGDRRRARRVGDDDGSPRAVNNNLIAQRDKAKIKRSNEDNNGMISYRYRGQAVGLPKHVLVQPWGTPR